MKKLCPDSLEAYVHNHIDHLYKPEDGTLLAVAVSGGADSLCLTLFAQKWAQIRGYSLKAVTVDHGLRPESKEEGIQVNSWLKAQGVDHTLLSCMPFFKNKITQKNARQARYQTLSSWCSEHNIHTLFLGHQGDDQLETLLMRLDHASGPSGLACMESRTHLFGLTLLRPLLGVRHSLLIEFLKQKGHPWIEDPSNQSRRFARTTYRLMVQELEKKGLNMDRTLKSIHKMAEHQRLWIRSAEDLIQKATYTQSDSIRIRRSLWCASPYLIQKKALEFLLHLSHKKPYLPKHSDLKIKRMLENFHSKEEVKKKTLGGWVFHFNSEYIHLTPEGRDTLK